MPSLYTRCTCICYIHVGGIVMKNVAVCMFCTLVLLASVMFVIVSYGVNKPSGDWIAGKVESGQDRYGNCYLYVRGWQWIERVPCDRIGKGG